MKKLHELKIEITNRCPLKCIHCSTGTESGQGSFLPLPLIQTFVAQAYELGCRRILFSGGEPLLHPHLETLIEHCYSKQFGTKIYTTGIQSAVSFHPVGIEKLKYLHSKGLKDAAFSLYSSRSRIHDLITDTSGSFEGTVAAIKNAVKAGIRTEVHFVAVRQNIDELLQLPDFVMKLGISRISVLRFVPQGRGECNAEKLIPSATDYVRLRDIIATIRVRSPISLRLGSPFNFLLQGSPSRCNTGKDRMIIDAHGLAHPCDALKQVKLPIRYNDAALTPLDQIMEQDPLFRTARKSRLPGACKACPDLTICRGGCPAQRILASGSSAPQKDPACLRDVLLQPNGDRILPVTVEYNGKMEKICWIS